jgi:hypothetical protein
MSDRPRRISRVSPSENLGKRSRIGALGLALFLALAPSAWAAPWEADVGDLGRNAHSFAVHVGLSYGTLTGSEVPKTEAGPGFEGGLSYRVGGNLSLYGGLAWHTSNVNGQIVSILDTNVRKDGRSGTVEGTVTTPRIRGGIRVDAYRMEDWKFQVYLMGGALYSMVEGKLDSIDGQSPPDPYEAPDGSEVDPGKIEANLWGAFGRVGVDYLLGERFAVDLNFTYETIDPPAGTNDLSTFTLGGTFRF